MPTTPFERQIGRVWLLAEGVNHAETLTDDDRAALYALLDEYERLKSFADDYYPDVDFAAAQEQEGDGDA